MSLREKPPYRIDELMRVLNVSRRFISDRMTPNGPVRWWKVGQLIMLDYDDVEKTFGNPNDSNNPKPPAAAMRLIKRAGL